VFDAYSNDADVLNIQGDDFTVTNGATCVTLSGSLDVTKDQRGLKAALALKAAVDGIVAALQREAALPARIQNEPDAKPGKVDNPFN
jgi:hypothetical protein